MNVARLHWLPSGVGPQRVEATVLEDGFDRDAYETIAELDADASAFSWTRPRGEALYHWRVRTRVAATWVSSDVATFQAPGCVGGDPPAP